MDFLEQLKEKYSDKLIVMVLDNVEYQHCDAVKEKADELGITLMFLPPYSPNLNIIERLWKFTKRRYYTQYYDNAEKIHRTIRIFLNK